MEKCRTKEQILDVALDLFSVQGFEATSISQIVDAVGIRKASLYSHFGSKQEILEALIKEAGRMFDENSLFKKVQWRNFDSNTDWVNELKEHVKYILHDDRIKKVRKFLVIEQFINPELARIQTERSFENVMAFGIAMVKDLGEKGFLIQDDPKILASQFVLPISMWINLVDRDPEREEEVLELIDEHMHQFFKVYGK